MPRRLAQVNPEALRWARESVGLTSDQAAERAHVQPEKLIAAEQGDPELGLSIPEAERVARAYDRPLVALFLPRPPEEATAETEFRRLRDAPSLPWPPEMHALVRRIRVRQQDAGQLYDELEESPVWPTIDFFLNRDASETAVRFRESHVPFTDQRDWRDRSGFRPLRAWIDVVEGLGVLVMQDGTMNLDEMRGFSSPSDDVPAIVVNTNDDPRARAFTVIHELGHLVGASLSVDEAWCNEFAAEVIAPAHDFRVAFHEFARALVDKTDELALSFGTTPLAAAVRMRRLGLINEQAFANLERELRERALRLGPARRGGNYYRNVVARLGPAYVQLVFEALDRGAITFSAASGLLNVKVNHFDELRKTTADRVGIA